MMLNMLGMAKITKKASFFSKKPGFYLMMVFVEVPKKAVHHPTVCTPGDGFHQ